jgi:dCMP deaminase
MLLKCGRDLGLHDTTLEDQLCHGEPHIEGGDRSFHHTSLLYASQRRCASTSQVQAESEVCNAISAHDFGSSEDTRSNLEDFVREDDVLVYGDTDEYTSFTLPLCQLNENVKLQILNSFDNIPDLHAYLDRLNLLDPSRLRPSWDSYFMTLASLAAQRSNCMKRRVGAILVRDHRILATGYNGTSRGLTNCNEGGCPLCNDITSPLQCICLHAEENAILEAGRERIGMSAVLYCNTCPCLKCTIIIIQAGVKEVVYELSYKVDEESAKRFEEAGVKLRRWTRFPQLELQHELQDTLATNSVIPPAA